MTKNKLKALLIILCVFIISSTVYLYQEDNNTIVIGTKNFTEQKIIGDILEKIIEENTSYNVKVLPGIGETSFLESALQKNNIDIYVDYTSTAYETILKHKYNGESSEKIYQTVKKEYQEKWQEDWISLLGFENSNALICGNYCKKNNITKISQLANYNNYKIAAQADFFKRSDGINLLKEKYGLKISSNNQIAMDHSLIFPALDNGDIDFAIAYTTDGQLKDDKYTVLKDDRNVFAHYDAGIVISETSKRKFPQVVQVLKDLQNSITKKEMQIMNSEVEEKEKSPSEVADEFVKKYDKIQINNKL